MAYKFIALFALLSVAKAAIIGQESHPTYSDATAVSYSSVSSPTHPEDTAPVASRAPEHYAPVYRPASYEHSAPAYKSFEVPSPSFRVAAPSFKVPAPSFKVAAPIFKVAAPSFKVAAPISAEESAPAHYAFGYEVNDAHTGDMHGQQETREGDVVRGSYYLMEADGSKRIVEYTADAHSGFNAVVRREGNAGPVKSAAPQAAHGYAVGRTYEPTAAKAGYYAAPSVSYSGPSASVGREQASSYYH